jgi:hypothetical protein
MPRATVVTRQIFKFCGASLGTGPYATEFLRRHAPHNFAPDFVAPDFVAHILICSMEKKLDFRNFSISAVYPDIIQGIYMYIQEIYIAYPEIT